MTAGRAERLVRIVDRRREFGFAGGVSTAAMGVEFPANRIGGLAPTGNVRYLGHVLIPCPGIPPPAGAGTFRLRPPGHSKKLLLGCFKVAASRATPRFPSRGANRRRLRQ